MRDVAEGVGKVWWEGGMGWGCCGWGFGRGGGSSGFERVLEDGDEEFDEEGGGDGGDAGAGDGALLVEGCVAEGLIIQLAQKYPSKIMINGKLTSAGATTSLQK